MIYVSLYVLSLNSHSTNIHILIPSIVGTTTDHEELSISISIHGTQEGADGKRAVGGEG